MSGAKRPDDHLFRIDWSAREEAQSDNVPGEYELIDLLKEEQLEGAISPEILIKLRDLGFDRVSYYDHSKGPGYEYGRYPSRFTVDADRIVEGFNGFSGDVPAEISISLNLDGTRQALLHTGGEVEIPTEDIDAEVWALLAVWQMRVHKHFPEPEPAD